MPPFRVTSRTQQVLPSGVDYRDPAVSHDGDDIDCNDYQSREGLGRLHRQVTSPYSSIDQESDSDSGLSTFLRENNPQGKWYAPHRGVCYEGLSTFGRSNEHRSAKTLVTALWRTLTFQDIIETVAPKTLSKGRSKEAAIISDFSGVVNNGEMLLVLGNPGSGCSTFLQTLGNDHASFTDVRGYLSWSGLSSNTIRAHHRGEVAYVPEDDAHFPTLTVKQTLEFALRSKLPQRYHQDIPAHLEVYGKSFGMSHVMDSLVGNEYIRGISGGEKKRLSIMESFAVDSSIVAWDNSTRGLDAASALNFARSLRILTDEAGKATIVTLYQTSDEALMLMDKLILIDQGRMLYQGPAKMAKAYFENLGYLCGERQRISDFLTSVTSPDQRKFKEGHEKSAPKGAIELEAAFRQSNQFSEVMDEVSTFKSHHLSAEAFGDKVQQPFELPLAVRKSRYEPARTSYNTSAASQLRICLLREWWQLKQHPWPLYVRLASVLINALLIGSMFYDQPQNTDGMYSRGGFTFYALITIGWIQLAELEGAMDGRLIISRHKQQAMVRPSLVGLSKIVFDLMVVFVEVVGFSVVTYFMGGLRLEAGAFFIYLLVLYVETVCFTQIYRLLAAVSPSFELALRYCGVMLLACILFGGYLYPLQKLLNNVPWVGWIAYVTPLLYGYEAITATEFDGLEFSCTESYIVPRGEAYLDYAQKSCSYPGSQVGSLNVLGNNYLSSYFGFASNHVWRNIGIIIAMTFAIAMITLYLLETIDWSQASLPNSGTIFSKSASRNGSKADVESQPSSSQTSPVDAPSQHKLDPSALTPSNSVFTFKDLTYTVETGGAERRLLDEVSGYCQPGELTALVGASGAGKTTLLTALSQRHKSGSLVGDVKVNDSELDDDFHKNIGFCTQQDLHDDISTVREACLFSALLRQDGSIADEEKIKYADSVIAALGLTEYNHALIGSLALELKRRTSIAVELSAKPSLLLFLDEPTSGLDSKGALSIIQLLRQLADAGQAIVCTIHQASHEQIALFDRLLALQPGGKVFYNGSVGHEGQAIFDYFERFGCSAAPDTNVADFIIDVGAGVVVSHTDPITDWAVAWKQSPEAQDVLKKIETSALRHDSRPKEDHATQRFASTAIQQARRLVVRNSRQFWRLPEYPYARLYACFVHALLNGLTYLQLGNREFDLQAMAFSTFLILMLVPEFINGISMRFIANRDLWLEKEYPGRVYGAFAFATSQIIAELPYAFVGAIIFFLLFYFMVGLPLGLPAFYAFLMTIMFHLFATSWGQWIAALSPDAMVAANLMPFFIVMCELFNGILRPPEQMPVFWRYTMYYLAPFTYWIGGMLAMVLQGRPVVCAPDELTHFALPLNGTAMTCGDFAAPFLADATGYISNPAEATPGALCGYCRYSFGDEYLSTYGLSTDNIWRDFGIFLGFVLANYGLVYLFVYWRTPRVKKVRIA